MTQEFIFDQTTSVAGITPSEGCDTLPGLTTALDALPSLPSMNTEVDLPRFDDPTDEVPGLTQAIRFKRAGRRLRRATGGVDLKSETVALVAFAKQQGKRSQPAQPVRQPKRKIVGFRRAKTANGIVRGPDFSSPQGTHRTMVDALKTNNLDVFLKSFDPPLLRKILGGFSPATEAGRLRGAKVMRALRRKFEACGYPKLGEELTTHGGTRAFAYFDPTNAQNKRCTYVFRHGRWVTAD